MSVLVQDVQVTSSNIFALSERLSDALNEYENDIIRLRQADNRMKLAKESVQYSSQSPNFHTMNSPNSSSSSSSSSSFSHFSSHLLSENHKIHQKTSSATDPSSIHSLDYALMALRLLPSDAKSVVILLTDGVSSYTHSSDFPFRDACRRLAREAAFFTVVQTGSHDGFTPGVNFGHVPDTEALQFLASAAYGKFLYGSDCKYLDLDPLHVPSSSSTTFSTSSSSLLTPSNLSTSNNASANSPSYSSLVDNIFRKLHPPPNFYHLHFLIRDALVDKLKDVACANEGVHMTGIEPIRQRPIDIPRLRLVNTSLENDSINPPTLPEDPTTAAVNDAPTFITSRQDPSLLVDGSVSYPWHSLSRPPSVAVILCGFKDYTVNSSLGHVVRARLAEGFAVKSIQILPRYRQNVSKSRSFSSLSSLHGSIPASLLEPNKRKKADKVEIILARPWLPHVTILYTIKARWTHPHLPLLEGGVSSESRPPRIELNIMAHHSFAILFVNVQESDLISSTSASQSQNNNNNNSNNNEFYKLHSYLRTIYETDDLLKVVASFNTKNVIASAYSRSQHRHNIFSNSASWSNSVGSGINLNSPSQLSPSSSFNRNISTTNNNGMDTIWQALCQIIISKASSFPEWDCDLILKSSSSEQTSLQSLSQYFASKPGGIQEDHSHIKSSFSLKPSDSLLELAKFFSNWCTFALNRTTFVKFITNSERSHVPPSTEFDPKNMNAFATSFSSSTSFSQSSISSSSSILSHIHPTGFAVLRLIYETDWLLSIKIGFFNSVVKSRRALIDDLCNSLKSMRVPVHHSSSPPRKYHDSLYAKSPKVTSTHCPIIICKKPIRKLLIRYLFKSPVQQFPSQYPHAQLENTPPQSILRVDSSFKLPLLQSMALSSPLSPLPSKDRATLSRAEASCSNAQLIALPAPKPYLRSHRWVWLSDVMSMDSGAMHASIQSQSSTVHPTTVKPITATITATPSKIDTSNILSFSSSSTAVPSHNENCTTSLAELSFQQLYTSRVDDGFLLVSRLPDSITLYAESCIDRIVKITGNLTPELRKLERSILQQGRKDISCAIQCVIMLDRESSTVVEELWVEPIVCGPADPTISYPDMGDAYDVKVRMK